MSSHRECRWSLSVAIGLGLAAADDAVDDGRRSCCGIDMSTGRVAALTLMRPATGPALTTEATS